MKKTLFIFIFLCVTFLCGCTQKAEKQIVIKFSSWGSRTEYAILKQVISKYEKENPNVKIELIHVPENYFRKLHLLYASKTEPDVVFVNNTYAPLYIKANLFEDLSGQINEDEYFKSSIDCFKYNDKLYAVPRDVSNLVLYVNKNLIKSPGQIKTLQDLKKAAKKVSKNGIFGLNYEKNPLFWLSYLEYFNGGILTDDGKNIILNSKESLKGLSFYADMINIDNSIPHDWQMSGMTSAQMFINGKTAMYLSGRWLVPKFRESITFDWDIIPFPQSKSSKILTDSSGWAVSKSSKYKKQAIDFVKYLASQDTIKTFTETGLITPARKDIAESNIFLSPELKPKNSIIFIKAIKNSKPTPVNSNYAKITDEVTKTAEKVFSEKQTVSEAINETLIKRLQNMCK
ncbi:MAG: ABC transporter substrate-binding protein [Candidatus Gastranaerophilaceae bacterium]